MNGIFRITVAFVGVIALLLVAATPAKAQRRSEGAQFRALAQSIGVDTRGVSNRELVEGAREFGITSAAQARRLLRSAPDFVVRQVARQMQARIDEVRNSRRVAVRSRNVRPQRVVVAQQPRVRRGPSFVRGRSGFGFFGSNVEGALADAIRVRTAQRIFNDGGNGNLGAFLLFQSLRGF